MGYLRFFLALAVVHGHLMGAGAFMQQTIAVVGFFTLSGFLITRVVCEVYGNSLKGKYYFLINRCIRIYPVYLACLAIACLCLTAIPDDALKIPYSGLYMPRSWMEWIPQFTIIGLTPLAEITRAQGPLPTAWSLGVELIYYLILGLCTGYSRRLTWCTFAVSLAVLAYCYMVDSPYRFFYKTIIGPSAIFFLGSLAYHYHKELRNWWLGSRMIVLLILANVVVYLPDMLNTSRAVWWSTPYIHYACIIMAWIIVSIYNIQLDTPDRKIQQFFADLSYPIFLLHWPVTAATEHMLGMPHTQTFPVFLVGLVSTLIAASAVVLCIDHPLKSYRRKIREVAAGNKLPVA